MSAPLTFPILLERFFTERLIRRKHVSPHTVASDRDTVCLLLRYARSRLHKGPSQLTLPDLDATLIAAVLDDLQTSRGTSARSRNVRLAAIHSFFRDAALKVPEHSRLIERVLAIPAKRADCLPHASGERSAAYRPGFVDVARTTRPHPAGGGAADRFAGL